MDTAQGTSVDSMIKNVPPPGSAERPNAIETLKTSVVHTARGMVEMHDKFASGDSMSAAAKKSDAGHMLGKVERMKGKFGGRDYDKVMSKFRDEVIRHCRPRNDNAARRLILGSSSARFDHPSRTAARQVR